MMLERTILSGLSPELRPRSQLEFSYRKHSDKMLQADSGRVVGVGASESGTCSLFSLGRPGLHRSLTTN